MTPTPAEPRRGTMKQLLRLPRRDQLVGWLAAWVLIVGISSAIIYAAVVTIVG